MPSRSRREPSLWSQAGRRAAAEHAPLAERLRPRRLDELVGLATLLAPGAPLRREVQSRRLASLLLWGPPGSGKTTLARVLASEAGHEFIALSAVSSGVDDVRSALDAADEAGVELPLTREMKSHLRAAIEAGYAGDDFIVLFQHLRSTSGLSNMKEHHDQEVVR